MRGSRSRPGLTVEEVSRRLGVDRVTVTAHLTALGGSIPQPGEPLDAATEQRLAVYYDLRAAAGLWPSPGATSLEDDTVRLGRLARATGLDPGQVVDGLDALGAAVDGAYPSTPVASTPVARVDAESLIVELARQRSVGAGGTDRPSPPHGGSSSNGPVPPSTAPRSAPGEATLRRVARFARPHAAAIAVLVGLDLLATPLTLLNPLPIKIVIDSVLGDAALPGWLDMLLPSAVATSTLALLAFAVALQIGVIGGQQLQALATYVWNTRVGEQLTLDLRTRLFRHAQRLSLQFHDQVGSTHALYRIEWDAQSVQHVVDTLVPFVTQGVMLLGILVVTALVDWQLALIALAVCPVIFGLSRRHITRVRGDYRQVRELESSALSVVQETLGALRVVKAFGREDAEQQRFRERSRRGVDAKIAISWREGSYGLWVGVATGVGTAAVLLVGARNVLAGATTVGDLVLITGYLASLYGPLREIAQRVGTLQDNLAGADRAFELLDELPEVPEHPEARPLSRAGGEIEFDDVTFGYEKGHPVLRDVNVRIPAGARVGIKGPTGAGKTTLVGLCLRFFDPDRGTIRLDGVDLRQLRLPDLRAQFALVLQEPVLFSTSIAENLTYAKPDATQSEIEAAARAAGAHEFIVGLSEGYDTTVGERGMRLSGGERQRLSLARAFLKDAPILVLDEPTSAVDRETEQRIIEALDRLMEGRTTLMIAHRLSTLESCDEFLEVRDGTVREVGSEPPEGGMPA